MPAASSAGFGITVAYVPPLRKSLSRGRVGPWGEATGCTAGAGGYTVGCPLPFPSPDSGSLAVPLTRITCPECGAGLKSPTGFAAGQTVSCPKCETYFTVEDPDDEPAPPAKAAAAKKPVKAVASRDEDDGDDDRPKKRKKKRRDEDDDEDDENGRAYKSSWIRYTILGVLVIVMLVLGYMLYQKRQKEKEDVQAPAPANSDDTPRGNPKAIMPGPRGPNAGMPVPNGVPFPPPQNPDPAGMGNAEGGPPGIFGPTPLANSAQGRQLTDDLTRRLAGRWEGTAPDGSTHRVEYRADGTFDHAVTTGGTAKSVSGKYTVAGLVGSKGLKLRRPIGSRSEANVVFEDDELVHDTGTPGEAMVLRKK
ncbi:MAG: hypothetical protein JWO38_6683 [Gemmataceae bacterium]|nr:hypothetical protein [Gemmataceae bacterium]